MDDTGARVCQELLGNNAEWGVAWVHSYVTLDKQKMYCIYDAPSPEAIRQAAERKWPAGGRHHRSAGAGPLFLPVTRLRAGRR